MSPWHALFRLIMFPIWSAWVKEEERKDPDVGEGIALGIVIMVLIAILVPAIVVILPILLPVIAVICVFALISWLAGGK